MMLKEAMVWSMEAVITVLARSDNRLTGRWVGITLMNSSRCCRWAEVDQRFRSLFIVRTHLTSSKTRR